MSIPLCRKRTRRTQWPSPPWFHVCLLYNILEFCLTVHCIGQDCRATLQRWPTFSTWCLQHRDSWLSELTAVQRWPLYYSGACSTEHYKPSPRLVVQTTVTTVPFWACTYSKCFCMVAVYTKCLYTSMFVQPLTLACLYNQWHTGTTVHGAGALAALCCATWNYGSLSLFLGTIDLIVCEVPLMSTCFYGNIADMWLLASQQVRGSEWSCRGSRYLCRGRQLI